MDAVRLEAVAPPPIVFPWMRALPGLVAGIFALMWFAIESIRLYEPHETSLIQGSWIERLTPLIAMADAAGLRWVLLSLVITAACVELTWRVSERPR